MTDPRPFRLPGILLIVVMCVAGVCAVPSASFFLAAALRGGPNLSPVLVLGVPTMLAFPAAVWLCSRSRRAGSAGRAWLLAVLGVVLVIGTSVLPVGIVGAAMVEEWEETQPGGRGYIPPERR